MTFHYELYSSASINRRDIGHCAGSNGSRTGLWKIELQKLANELQMEIHVSHFPSGTSKWNKIDGKVVKATYNMEFRSVLFM